MKGSSWVGNTNHNHRSSANNNNDTSASPLSHKILSPILSNSQDQQIYIPSGQFKDIATASISLKSPRSNSNSPTSMRHMLSPRHLTKFSRTSSPQANSNPKISSPLSPSSPYESTFQSLYAHDQQLVAYNSSNRSLVVSSPSNTSTNISTVTQKKKKKKKKKVKPIVTFESHNDSPSPRIDPYQIARMEMSKKLKQNQNIKEKIQTINNIDNSTIMAEEQEQELEQLQREQVQQQQLQKLHQIQQQHQIEQEQQQLEHQRILKEQEQRRLQVQQLQARRQNFEPGYPQLLNDHNNESHLASMVVPEKIHNHINSQPENSSELGIRNNMILTTGVQPTQEHESNRHIGDKPVYSRQFSRRRKYQNNINEETILEGQEYDFNVREKNHNFEDTKYCTDRHVNNMVDFNLSKKSSNDDRRLSSLSLSSSNTISTIAESALQEHNIPIFFSKNCKETDGSSPLDIESENKKDISKGHSKNEKSISSVVLDKDRQFPNVVIDKILSPEQSLSHLQLANINNPQKTIKLTLTNNVLSSVTNLRTSVVNPFTYHVGNSQINNHTNNDIGDDKFFKLPPQTSCQKDLPLQVLAQAPLRLVPDVNSYKISNAPFEGKLQTKESQYPEGVDVIITKETTNGASSSLPSRSHREVQYKASSQIEKESGVSNHESPNLQSKLHYTAQDPRESEAKTKFVLDNRVHEISDPQTAKSEYFLLDISIGDKVERQSPEIQSSYLNFREKSKFMSPAEKYSIQQTIQNVSDATIKKNNHQNGVTDSPISSSQQSYSKSQERSFTSFAAIVSPTSPLFNNGRNSNFAEPSGLASTNSPLTKLRSNLKNPGSGHSLDRNQTYKRRNNPPKIPGTIPYPVNDETLISEHEITEITPVQESQPHVNKESIPQLDSKKVDGNMNNNTGLFVFSVNFNESQLSLTNDPTIKARSKSDDADTESLKLYNSITNISKSKSLKSGSGLNTKFNIYETNKLSDDIIISACDTYSESGSAEGDKTILNPIKQSKSFRKMSFLSDTNNSEIGLPNLEDKIKKHDEDHEKLSDRIQKNKKKVYRKYNIMEKSKQRNFSIDVTNMDNIFVFDELGIFDEIEITGVSDVEASLKIKKPMSHTFTVFIEIIDLYPTKNTSKFKAETRDGSLVHSTKTVQIRKITGYLLPFETENFEVEERSKHGPTNTFSNPNANAITQLAREKTELLLLAESATLQSADPGMRYSTTSLNYKNDEDELSAFKHMSKLSISSSVYE